MPTVTMQAPTPGHTFVGLPSGAIYIADTNALVSADSADVMGLLNAGCTFTFTTGDEMTYQGTPSITYAPITITSGTFTLTQANDLIEVNKTTGSATAIALPVMTADHQYQVKDAKGDAGTNNITITTTNGDGKIDGNANVVINQNLESLTLVFDGTTTKIV